MPSVLSAKGIAGEVLETFHSKGFYTKQVNKDGSISIVRTKLSEAEYRAAKRRLGDVDPSGKKKRQGKNEQ